MSNLSNKLDAVSKNKIWDEHVRKENKTIQYNDNFVVTDPRRMDIYPEKPNNTIPGQNPDAATLLSATRTLQGFSTLKDTEKTPAERFALPVTGNMEYGFFNRIANEPNPMFNYKITKCDVTDYAQEYVASNGGVGPFNRKD